MFRWLKSESSIKLIYKAFYEGKISLNISREKNTIP